MLPKILTLEELQSINALEQEFKNLQQLEINIIKEGNPIDKLISKKIGAISIYTDPEQLERMISSLKTIISGYVDGANVTGKLLSEKAVSDFLKKSERADRLQRQERLILTINRKRAKRRLSIAIQELRKEGNILDADISLFIKRKRIMGADTKDILLDLIRMGRNKQGFAEVFKNKVKRLAIDSVKFEQRQAEIDHYRVYTKKSEQWQWITVSKNPCPDCQARAGSTLSFQQWKKIGLPGSGNTVCNKYCLCKLYPVSIAEDKFPNVKEFKISKDNLVLTPVGEFNLMKRNKK